MVAVVPGKIKRIPVILGKWGYLDCGYGNQSGLGRSASAVDFPDPVIAVLVANRIHAALVEAPIVIRTPERKAESADPGLDADKMHGLQRNRIDDRCKLIIGSQNEIDRVAVQIIGYVAIKGSFHNTAVASVAIGVESQNPAACLIGLCHCEDKGLAVACRIRDRR